MLEIAINAVNRLEFSLEACDDQEVAAYIQRKIAKIKARFIPDDYPF